MEQRRYGSLDVRVPEWIDDELVDTPCPLCGDRTPDTLGKRPDGLAVNRCSCCGLLYICPRPSDEAIARFYANYSRFHAKIDYGSEEYWSKTLNSRHAIPHSDPRIFFLASQGVRIRGARVLDIGCGDGSFLMKCRELGARAVLGVEPDRGLAAAARSHLGIDIVGGYLEDVPEKEGNFDLVTLWDVVEHLSNPCGLLTSIAGHLDQAGLIAGVTPNAGEYPREMMNWTGFRVDYEHICYYTRVSLHSLFSSCGFRLLATSEFGYPSLDTPARTGEDECRTRALITRSIRRVPPVSAVLVKLFSAMATIENMGHNALGSYQLYFLGSRR